MPKTPAEDFLCRLIFCFYLLWQFIFWLGDNWKEHPWYLKLPPAQVLKLVVMSFLCQLRDTKYRTNLVIFFSIFMLVPSQKHYEGMHVEQQFLSTWWQHLKTNLQIFQKLFSGTQIPEVRVKERLIKIWKTCRITLPIVLPVQGRKWNPWNIF